MIESQPAETQHPQARHPVMRPMGDAMHPEAGGRPLANIPSDDGFTGASGQLDPMSPARHLGSERKNLVATPLAAWKDQDIRLLPLNNALLASQDPLLQLVIGDVKPLAEHLPIIVGEHEGALQLIGLNIPADDRNLFADHTPTLYRHYPLVVTAQWQQTCLSRHEEDAEMLRSYALLDDSLCLQRHYGYRLFDQGRPTPYLKRQVLQLKDGAIQLKRTWKLLTLLNRAGALTPVTIYHQGATMACYLINDKAVGEQLHKAADDPNDIYQAIAMARDIATSQEGLELTICTA